jgi:hypothetical protein
MVHFESRDASALRIKRCTSKQGMVHFESNLSALQSKKWCTGKQISVHLEATRFYRKPNEDMVA